MLTMQDALLRLTEYWAGLGCVVSQPMNTEVGAGTLNPATFLRVLGPEPWRVAYVEPSVRPDDSRYGDNPNRLQMHTQYQVILKPEPGNAQELYLDSLRVLGIDVDAHDIRFVEDNWASPALGAWGLGWEVWLDGLEITQFTYFQQAGGLPLDPVAVEITYGVERILMALQGVNHVKDILYAPGLTWGEVYGQAEFEMSTYYLDSADIEANRQLFETYEAEARRMLQLQLPIPAHSYVLKCSHAFNVLDSRGAIGTTERARAFARMRNLAREVAELWIERRKELGHPLGDESAKPVEAPKITDFPHLDAPAPLAFEIGVEELPAAEVTRQVEAVREALAEKLAETRLGHGEIRVFGSPRRIVALVDAVEPVEAEHERTIKGPRVTAAYDEDGRPTQAAKGFARAQGVSVDQLERITIDGVEYVGVRRPVAGRPAAEVLAEVLPAVVLGLRADKNMRWNAPGLSFSRPIRWILALLGEHVVPFQVSTLTSDRVTRVHRSAEEPAVEVPTAEGYLSFLARHGILANVAERRAQIVTQAQDLASTVGGVIDVQAESDLLDEIANLVEEPVPLLGRFDEKYLALPTEVLSTVMHKKQRYLPVRDVAGRLLPYYVAVANGECDVELAGAGYDAVLRARYEDASFFWKNDLKVEPAKMKHGLAKLTFAERLGSMADRSARIASIAYDIAERIEISPDDWDVLARAASLAKFDLASEMVIELPTLAGVMAREYALRAGEPEAVATALYEMELPRHADDELPKTLPGAILALADRLDLLAGLFALGTTPSGSSDPFGLRRAALGVTAILREHPLLQVLTVEAGLVLAGRHQPVELSDQALSEALGFVLRRIEQQLLDAGHTTEVVRAVLPVASSPAVAERSAAELSELLGDPEFKQVAQAMQRVRRIVPAGTPSKYYPALFTSEAETDLHEALAKAQNDLTGAEVTPAQFLDAAARLAQPIERFFTEVMVMVDDDPVVKANRLGLLSSVRALGEGVVAWDQLTI